MDGSTDSPSVCPVCDTAYDSVSVHESGLMVNLRENHRYRRVCFDPIVTDETAAIRFYHHTHEQAGTAEETDGVVSSTERE